MRKGESVNSRSIPSAMTEPTAMKIHVVYGRTSTGRTTAIKKVQNDRPGETWLIYPDEIRGQEDADSGLRKMVEFARVCALPFDGVLFKVYASNEAMARDYFSTAHSLSMDVKYESAPLNRN